MPALVFNVRRERKAHPREAPPQAQIGFCFRLDGLHANGLVSYAFDGKVTTNKSLGEAARVRRDAHRA